jgi:hypothetical protein
MSVKPTEKSGEKDIFKLLQERCKMKREKIDLPLRINSLQIDDLIMVKMKGLGAEYFGRFKELIGVPENGKRSPGTVPQVTIRIISYEHPFDVFSVSGGKETIFSGDVESIIKITPDCDVLQHICSFLGGNKSIKRKSIKRKSIKRKTNKRKSTKK